MADREQPSLRAVYSDAEQKRTIIENSFDSNSASFQDNLTTAIQLYEECVKVAEQISLFSPNESLEDIGTSHLQYLLLHYRIAELVQKLNTGIEHRKSNLERAQRHYEKYLKQLDNYDILSKSNAKLLQQYHDSPTTFSTASTTDAALRRDTKIRRFKEEKSLKQKLEFLRQNPRLVQEDDSKAREVQLTEIEYCTHQTLASLEGIAQELQILAKAPPPSAPRDGQVPRDLRERERAMFDKGYTERLDGPSHLSAGMKGPLLDKSGKPLRPFTLLARDEMRQGVFRPDHSLPTMTIDEYLEEERRRGGMIDGGGEASRQQKVVDEDDVDAADQATYKAREWDEYVEANPKGSGNTINRG
ncbi:hypothetical protein AC578_3956 [Pseudocercospora eumusae]|uniref:TAP42-like protein n=1 Tax=Pseudocercospora eumusae TaxID=321146 RepID=A0A139HLJ0_9PEZI|nr:hypothetical protein AC578_3956 [Pseudocercospora eumusae]